MAYIYLAKYKTNSGFQLKTPSSGKKNYLTAFYHSLKNFKPLSPVNTKDETLYFYIVYHPTGDFISGTQKKFLAQYLFIYNDEWKTQLLSNSICENIIEQDRFITPDFNEVYSMKDTAGIMKILDREYPEIIKQYQWGADKFKEMSMPLCPAIHLTDFDILFLEEQKSKQDENKDLNEKEQKICRIAKVYRKEMDIPRYVQIMDNGIWNQYAPIITSDEETFQERMQRCIDKIGKYEEYYELDVAKENADLNARLLCNSYIAGNDSHARAVAPFLFHSEIKMNKLMKKDIGKSKLLTDIRDLKIHILLVDDHAQESMSTSNENKNINKKEIIEKLLEDLQKQVGKEDLFKIDIATSVQKARNQLKERTYDIILLDYLLNNKKETIQYSYDILNEIHGDSENHKKIVGNKYFFMHISAFGNAITQRMQESGYPYSTSYWYIARGACPTTTPELFKYNFYQLIKRKIQYLLDKEEYKKEDVSILELIKHIYQDSDKARGNAINKFNELFRLRAKYDGLRKFCCCKEGKKEENCMDIILSEARSSCEECRYSALLYSIYPDIYKYTPAFWEHMIHLVYLTAFGTGSRWKEIMSELKSIYDVMGEIDDETRNGLKKIEDYIIELSNIYN